MHDTGALNIESLYHCYMYHCYMHNGNGLPSQIACQTPPVPVITTPLKEAAVTGEMLDEILLGNTGLG